MIEKKNGNGKDEKGVKVIHEKVNGQLTLCGDIHLDSEQEEELHIALMAGYTPSFIVMEG